MIQGILHKLRADLMALVFNKRRWKNKTCVKRVYVSWDFPYVLSALLANAGILFKTECQIDLMAVAEIIDSLLKHPDWATIFTVLQVAFLVYLPKWNKSYIDSILLICS